MLQPREALGKVLESTQSSASVLAPLAEACSLVTAEEVVSPAAYPFFSNSSMDGYAVRSVDLKGASADEPVILPLAGEVRAASGETLRLPPGRTIRIMTGGALPEGADAVVKREDVKEAQGRITFYRAVDPGSSINRQGEEIAAGTVLWPAGRRINPAALGLFASQGIDRVNVFPAPKVSLVTTGDELVEVGSSRTGGQIYDSISPMLVSCLEQAGAGIAGVLRCGDDLNALSGTIQEALKESDITITVGGVSMGDYDLVLRCLEQLGVERMFWKVAQKPGKPLFFGKSGRKLVFGLPGNPASSLVCYLLYVLPAIRQMMGYPEPGPFWYQGRLAADVSNNDSRTFFARGIYVPEHPGGYRLETALGQSSYMLSSFAGANALIELPPGPVTLEAGRKADFTPLSWTEPVC